MFYRKSGKCDVHFLQFVKCTLLVLYVSEKLQTVSGQRNSLPGGRRNSPSNYKDALMVYPTGIRSERDLPVCPTWVVEEESKDEVGPSFSPGVSSSAYYAGNDGNKLQQPHTTKNPSDSKRNDDLTKYLSACNIIHKRYFYPIMIERLCRCPDRTECPMEWSPPPLYRDLITTNDNNKKGSKQQVSTTPTSKSANVMDPLTVMVSSRTQLKFCTEVANVLPKCEQPRKHKDINAANENPAMVKTVRKTFLYPELPGVSVNCYCPPLYRGWTFLSKTDPTDHGNGTAEANFFYRCDKLPKCKFGQSCGTVRTDLHFSYYHCSCPRNHLCVPKVYPPLSSEDVIDEGEEALYSGQVAPAYCTPE